MKKIQLGGHNRVRGEHRVRGFAIVDDEDFDALNKYNWLLTSTGHASARVEGKAVYMHRLINETPDTLLTDHINRNPLDNRKINLRTADKSINSINRGLQSNNTSGIKGVSWSKQHGRWETYIWKNRKKIFLGLFKEIVEAVKARQIAESEYHAI